MTESEDQTPLEPESSEEESREPEAPAEAEDTPAAVRNAVELHNETTQHRQWQNWRED